MRFRKVFLLTAILFFSSGCVLDTPSAIKPNKPAFYGTYLFVGECQTKFEEGPKTEGFAGEVLGSIVSGVIKTGVDWIGAALKKAAEDDIEKTTVNSNVLSVSSLNHARSCLQVVRGKFELVSKAVPADETFDNRFAGKYTETNLAKLKLIDGTEELFIEVLPIYQEKVVSFVPLKVRYSGYTPSDKRSKSPRDLAVFIGYSTADKTVAAGDFNGRLINFGTLTPDGTNPATIDYVHENKLSLVNHSQWMSFPEALENQPITFAATVIETRKANQFVKFLASAFASSQDDIKSKAVAAAAELDIFKSSKDLEAEKIKLAQSQLDLEQAYFNAESTVLEKTSSLANVCSTSPLPETKKIYDAQEELYMAKKKSNLAAYSAGMKIHYQDGDLIAPTGVCLH